MHVYELFEAYKNNEISPDSEISLEGRYYVTNTYDITQYQIFDRETNLLMEQYAKEGYTDPSNHVYHLMQKYDEEGHLIPIEPLYHLGRLHSPFCIDPLYTGLHQYSVKIIANRSYLTCEGQDIPIGGPWDVPMDCGYCIFTGKVVFSHSSSILRLR